MNSTELEKSANVLSMSERVCEMTCSILHHCKHWTS